MVQQSLWSKFSQYFRKSTPVQLASIMLIALMILAVFQIAAPKPSTIIVAEVYENMEQYGANIVLCRKISPDAKQDLEQVYERAAAIANDLGDDKELSLFRLVLDEVKKILLPYGKQAVSASPGIQQLKEVPAGEYVLFAQSMNENTYVSWMLPMRITAGGTSKIMLDKSNTFKVINISSPADHMNFPQGDDNSYFEYRRVASRGALEKLIEWNQELEEKAKLKMKQSLKDFKTSGN